MADYSRTERRLYVTVRSRRDINRENFIEELNNCLSLKILKDK